MQAAAIIPGLPIIAEDLSLNEVSFPPFPGSPDSGKLAEPIWQKVRKNKM